MSPVMTGYKTDQFLQSGWAKDGMTGRARPFDSQPFQHCERFLAG
jgi:hypothetical protein